MIAEYTDEIEQCKKEIMELLGSRASTTAKMQHFDTTREQIQTRKAVIARGLLEVATEAEEQNLILKKHEEELQAVQKEIAECNAKISENERELERLQKELREKQEKLKIGQTAYHRESSRLESLKNITERYDGYGNSIRKVMAKKEQEPGLIGVVADIIKVEQEYEIAIETALGGSIQNIVSGRKTPFFTKSDSSNCANHPKHIWSFLNACDLIYLRIQYILYKYVARRKGDTDPRWNVILRMT